MFTENDHGPADESLIQIILTHIYWAYVSFWHQIPVLNIFFHV